jgi:hypothetical protein
MMIGMGAVSGDRNSIAGQALSPGRRIGAKIGGFLS